MTAATYSQFIDAIQALAVSGVKRKYDEPPVKMNTADLPCSFVWFPSGDNAPLTFEGGREFRQRAVDLIVVYATTALGADQPFTNTITMMDNVESALLTLDIGYSNPAWNIRSQLYLETDKARFWAIIATIRGTG